MTTAVPHIGALDAPEAAPDDRLVEAARETIIAIGEDPGREGLARTPERVARSWRFLTQGYQTDLDELVNSAIFDEKCGEIVAVKNIRFFSMCEHHMLPFFGICHVGYIPNGRVIGLSKIPRIVDMFARRLQIQERLTQQIAAALNQVLNPRGVAIVMEAHHLCMMMRGVEKESSLTLTSEMTGAFRENRKTREEFLGLAGMRIIP
ncbi:GTP cyclohydrolase I FolE [bacterium]|nr:GTP cyclohydrolase I FolE [bacterium]